MCSVYCHVIITLVCVLLPTCKYVCMFVCSVYPYVIHVMCVVFVYNLKWIILQGVEFY